MARVAERQSLQIILSKHKYPPILDLLNLMRDCKCSVAKGKVFGMMGMVKMFLDASLGVDYAMSTAEIYLSVAQYLIQTTK